MPEMLRLEVHGDLSSNPRTYTPILLEESSIEVFQ